MKMDLFLEAAIDPHFGAPGVVRVTPGENLTVIVGQGGNCFNWDGTHDGNHLCVSKRLPAVPNGGILTGIPEGAMFLLRMGNPAHSSLWFFAAGGSTNGCHHCDKMLGDSGMFMKNKDCGASRACIFYAGPGQGMGVQAKSGSSFLAYVFY